MFIRLGLLWTSLNSLYYHPCFHLVVVTDFWFLSFILPCRRIYFLLYQFLLLSPGKSWTCFINLCLSILTSFNTIFVIRWINQFSFLENIWALRNSKNLFYQINPDSPHRFGLCVCRWHSFSCNFFNHMFVVCYSRTSRAITLSVRVLTVTCCDFCGLGE